MNTREDIEQYLENLGIKIQSKKEEIVVTEHGEEELYYESVMPITGEKIKEDNIVNRATKKVLNKDAENALLELIGKSITSGDMETAKISLEVLQEESSFYKGHRNAALERNIPLDKVMEFDKYYEEQNKQFTGHMAAFMASANKIASTRRMGQINNTISEIRESIIKERENNEKVAEDDKEK